MAMRHGWNEDMSRILEEMLNDYDKQPRIFEELARQTRRLFEQATMQHTYDRDPRRPKTTWTRLDPDQPAAAQPSAGKPCPVTIVYARIPAMEVMRLNAEPQVLERYGIRPRQRAPYTSITRAENGDMLVVQDQHD